MTDLGTGPDGVERCSWATAAQELLAYHDGEWGQPLLDDNGLFEHLCLEAFQSGLSWLTVLRKRPAFREVFADFQIEAVAQFGDDDIARLLADERIIRNRQKITAAIENARAARELIANGDSLSALIWSHRPEPTPAPRSYADLPTSTPESAALAKELKRRGFCFIGPTTAYALMQACGLVNDHLEGCAIRESATRAQTDAAKR